VPEVLPCRVAIKVLNYIADLGVILVALPFGILPYLPEAQGWDAFCVRHEHNFIHQNPFPPSAPTATSHVAIDSQRVYGETMFITS